MTMADIQTLTKEKVKLDELKEDYVRTKKRTSHSDEHD